MIKSLLRRSRNGEGVRPARCELSWAGNLWGRVESQGNGCLVEECPRGWGWGLRDLTRRGGQCLLHGFPIVRDLAAVSALRFPLVSRQAQVAAGRVFIVALFRGLGGLHTLGDVGAVCLPGHSHAARVEVTDETHQCGLVGFELLRGGREQSD